ncbi:MAG: hypothetical protein M3042_05175 [Actinomycetota bacterium]|nr:hypothetical protein [Actinomycetota bacterium]
MRIPRARSRTVALGAVGSVLVAGCSAGSPSHPTLQALHLHATVQQDRIDATNRQVSIPLVNTGPSEVTIEQVQLDAPEFTTVPPKAEADRLPVGGQLNFPVNFGAARCAGQPPGHGPVVRLRLRDGSGRSRALRLPIADSDGLLERLRRQECEQRALTAAFSVEYGPASVQPRTPRHPVLRGTLIVRRRGSMLPLVVIVLRGSVLFDLNPPAPAHSPVASLPAGAASLSIPVEMSVPRCEPHVLIEAKKIFFFSIGLQIGSAPVQYLQIPPPDPIQRGLRTLVTDCQG